MSSSKFVRHSCFHLAALAMLASLPASAATFGKVVSIGGHASDLALDEPRGVLYIANYTSSRIDVMSLSDYSIGRSITVATYPGSIALSPDGQYLVVTHYAFSNGAVISQPGQDAVTVVDLKNNQKRTFGLSSGPVGVAFGMDGVALILTQNEFLLMDPASGKTTVLATVGNVKSQVLPVASATFPSQIMAGALTATMDGRHIIGIGGSTPDTGSSSSLVRFSYNVLTKQLTANELLSTSPSLGPRVISASRDGSYYMSGWALVGCGLGALGDCTADGPLLAQWPNGSGALNVGSVAVRSSKSLIYAQLVPQGPPAPPPTAQTICFPDGRCVTVTDAPPATPIAAKNPLPPNMLVLDADNLTVRERIQLPENLAGRSVFNSDESTLYSISDSGVTVIPMAQFEKAPRVMASVEDVVFRGNFCNSGPITQQMDVIDPGGNATGFQVCLMGSSTCSLPSGITVTPSSAVTPARIKITMDPSFLGNTTATKAYTFEIRSVQAINMPPPPSRGRVETNYDTNVRSRFRLLINNRVPENRGTFINTPGQLVDLLADPSRNRFYVLRQDKNQVLVYDASSYQLIATLRTGNTPTQMAITFDRSTLLVANDNSQIANRYDLNSLAAVQPILFPIGHYPRSIAVSSRSILAASRVAGTVHTIDRIDLASGSATPLPSLGPYKNDVHISTTLAAAPGGRVILAAMPDGNLMVYNAATDSFSLSRKDFTELKGSLAASSFGLFMVDHYMLNESLVEMGSILPEEDASSGFAFIDRDGVSTAVRPASRGGSGYIQRMSTGGGLLPTGMVEAPVTGDLEYPFTRTLAPLPSRSAMVQLTTSGFTVLPWEYDAATASPVLDTIVNAADLTKPVAPGGLISIFGKQLSPMVLASTDAPLPTVLADSCLTVNGMVIPLQFVSPAQINAQLPFQIAGSAAVVLHTPGGVSDSLNLMILPAAPSVFRSGTAGPLTDIATIVRASNNELVTASNPVHPDDRLVIYLTGLGNTFPEIDAGAASPSDPLASAVIKPTATLGGVSLAVEYAGLTPGSVGLYQINVRVPFKGMPTGFGIPLTISQGGLSTTIQVRLVN